MSHTKGPWKTQELPSPVFGRDGSHVDNTVGVYSDNSARTICKIGGLLDKNTNANARLITAAPELLEALEDAEFIMRKLAIHPHDGPMFRDTLKRSVEMATAAIAKARGNQ